MFPVWRFRGLGFRDLFGAFRSGGHVADKTTQLNDEDKANGTESNRADPSCVHGHRRSCERGRGQSTLFTLGGSENTWILIYIYIYI